MSFEISRKLKAELQRVATPWGSLVGVKTDRITQTITTDGQYEWAETAIVGQLLRAGATAIDVGANIGYYTALFARLVGEKGSVHAFEANPFTAALLQMSKERNDWTNVTANNLAVGSAVSTMQVKAMNVAEAIHDSTLNLGGWSLRESATGGWDIEVVTLDQYVRDHNLEKVHFLKVDVEGFELKVLQGAEVLLKKFKPYLIMEMRSGNEAEWRKCEQTLELLAQRDFTCCRIMKRPFPHFRTIGQSDLVGGKFHFNLLAMPSARYREFDASLNWKTA